MFYLFECFNAKIILHPNCQIKFKVQKDMSCLPACAHMCARTHTDSLRNRLAKKKKKKKSELLNIA